MKIIGTHMRCALYLCYATSRVQTRYYACPHARLASVVVRYRYCIRRGPSDFRSLNLMLRSVLAICCNTQCTIPKLFGKFVLSLLESAAVHRFSTFMQHHRDSIIVCTAEPFIGLLSYNAVCTCGYGHSSRVLREPESGRTCVAHRAPVLLNVGIRSRM
jgi:hypothetical protein